MEQKQLTDEERVFGVGFERDENGKIIERGTGSKFQNYGHLPTVTPSTAATKETYTNLFRLIAAAGPGSHDLMKQFAEFLAWQKEHGKV